MSSNVSQNYPYSSESEEERAAAVAAAFAAIEGLEDKVAAETTPLGRTRPARTAPPSSGGPGSAPSASRADSTWPATPVDRHGAVHRLRPLREHLPALIRTTPRQPGDGSAALLRPHTM